MKVVFVSSEVTPFAKTGGLTDVSCAIPKVLAKKGIEMSVFKPLYKNVKKKKFLINPVTPALSYGGKGKLGKLRRKANA